MAKKRKNAIPKRIAGMKVPKGLRKGRVGQLLASPVGQALIVGAVARAGETLIGRAPRPGSADGKAAAQSQGAQFQAAQSQGAQSQAAQAQAAVAAFSPGAGESSAAFVYALRQAARAFVTAMQEQRVAARAEGGGGREPGPEPAGRDEESVAKKDQGVRPDRCTAH